MDSGQGDRFIWRFSSLLLRKFSWYVKCKHIILRQQTWMNVSFVLPIASHILFFWSFESMASTKGKIVLLTLYIFFNHTQTFFPVLNGKDNMKYWSKSPLCSLIQKFVFALALLHVSLHSMQTCVSVENLTQVSSQDESCEHCRSLVCAEW